ncbi:MAG: D-glycero-beta-D-manno-heptose-7-phosphate kinase [Candidatus Cloacimonetes bacterium]|nr:D-glycero-beta-D-manno-heptose-7-phosphate kinase [Candidatus Cloacimonadota bacterium]
MQDSFIDINDLNQTLSDFNGKRIVVIGDLMLDHYLWGNVNRISPEAPVPIVDINKEEFRLGGAANVVNNIVSLKGIPIVIGVIGRDSDGEQLLNLLNNCNAKTDYIIKDSKRKTTIKTRVFAAGQQIVRYDMENTQDISKELEDKVLHKIELALANADAVILEDYNKGLLTEKVIKYIIKKANQLDIPITVDPKFKNFFAYKNCTVFKPNFIELQKNLSVEIQSDDDLFSAAQEVFRRIKPEYLVITLGDKGLRIFDKEQQIIQIPTFAKEVYDVSGAGDTVISVLTLCLSSSCDIKKSAIIANHAAGAVCGKKGIYPATKEDIVLSAKYIQLLEDN